MNKAEFLTALTKKLTALSDQEREDILSEYSQYIEDKMATGLTEEEAICGFGEIGELSEALILAYSDDPNFKINSIINRAAYYTNCVYTFIEDGVLAIWKGFCDGCLMIWTGVETFCTETTDCILEWWTIGKTYISEGIDKMKAPKEKEETMEKETVNAVEPATTPEQQTEAAPVVVEQKPVETPKVEPAMEPEPKVESSPAQSVGTNKVAEGNTPPPQQPAEQKTAPTTKQDEQVSGDLYYDEEEKMGPIDIILETFSSAFWGVVAFFAMIFELVLLIPFLLVTVLLGGSFFLFLNNYPVLGVMLILLGMAVCLGSVLYLIYYYVLGGAERE